jgi:hypothetical protein
MLPLCFEKKKEDKKRRNRGRVSFRMNARFFFILSNAHRTSSRALSLSLLCVTSHGRVVVVKKLLLLSNLIIPLFDFIRARC